MLAMIYEQGMGVEVDDETAKSWRLHAAMAKANRERKEARQRGNDNASFYTNNYHLLILIV